MFSLLFHFLNISLNISHLKIYGALDSVNRDKVLVSRLRAIQIIRDTREGHKMPHNNFFAYKVL